MRNDDLLALAHRLADLAAKETLPRFRTGLSVTNKDEGGFDPVTEADREAERAIRAAIDEACPEHGIKGEEFPEKEGAGRFRWVLDPVDGTRAFICGIPMWTTLIGLEENGEPVLGVIDQPFLKERWAGGSLPGTERPARTVSECRTLADAKMMVTDMRAGEYFTAEEAEAAMRLAQHVRLTRQGLDSYGFVLVASGHMDLVVEGGLSWHDIAAVIPVIRAAGGVMTDWTGKPLRDGSGPYRIIAAASQDLAAEAAKVLAG
jgi:myo-inositol-1(or 4)-monophosphatase